jgi:transposase InsO family protein
MRCSTGRKGDCRDHSPTESFRGMKNACVHGASFPTRQAMQETVLDWIAFCNHPRLHLIPADVSPMQFEQSWHAAQRKTAG